MLWSQNTDGQNARQRGQEGLQRFLEGHLYTTSLCKGNNNTRFKKQDTQSLKNWKLTDQVVGFRGFLFPSGFLYFPNFPQQKVF